MKKSFHASLAPDITFAHLSPNGQSTERKQEDLHTMQEGWDDFHEWQALRERRILQGEGQEQSIRLQLQELLPLPRRVVPQPWEDLASVITRTAQIIDVYIGPNRSGLVP